MIITADIHRYAPELSKIFINGFELKKKFDKYKLSVSVYKYKELRRFVKENIFSEFKDPLMNVTIKTPNSIFNIKRNSHSFATIKACKKLGYSIIKAEKVQ